MSRKERIYRVIKQHTEQLIRTRRLANNGIDALEVSQALGLNRANVSKELNNLWHEGRLVKIQGKPVLFVDYYGLVNAFPDRFIPLSISKNDTLTSYTENINELKDFHEKNNAELDITTIIGSDGSLREAFSKAKAAIAYPPYGLHMLIVGNPGTGRKDFINHIHRYAVKNGLKPEDSRLITINCQSYAFSPQLLFPQLFGCTKFASDIDKPIKGMIEKSGGGVIYFDGIHNLPSEYVDVILDAIDKSSYSRIGENTQRPLNATIAMSISQTQDGKLASHLQSHIPVTVNIPDIDSRGIYEKILIVLEAFSKEAQNIQQAIHVHKDIILCYTTMNYRENRTQLSNEIKLACSRALLDAINNNSRIVTLGYQHLSESILISHESGSEIKERALETLSIIPNDYILFNADSSSAAITYLKNPPRHFSNVINAIYTDKLDIIAEKNENMPEYINDMISACITCSKSQLITFQERIPDFITKTVIDQLGSNPEFRQLLKYRQILSGLLLYLSRIIEKNNSLVSDSSSYSPPLSRNGSECRGIEEKIMENLYSKYGLQYSDRDIEFVSAYISSANDYVSNLKVSIMVVCHGEATASDMVRYTKKYADPELKIAGIDFPSNMNMKVLLENVLLKAKEIHQGAGILVLADMEPLISIAEYIFENTGIESRAIYPVTLDSLRDFADKCMKGTSLYMFSSAYKIGMDKSSQEEPAKYNKFIDRFVKDVLSGTLIFINPQKAIDTLMDVLKNILEELKISYSNEIAVKFLSHCAHMLERVIRNEPLTYIKLKQFTNENYRLMSTIEKYLSYAANTFGVAIPSSEIAFITEIFVNYIATNI